MGPDVIVPAVVFGTFGFVVWVLANGWLRRQQIKVLTEFNGRLLERIGSVKDFGEFLATDGGARFIERVTAFGALPDVRVTILRSVQTGIVLLTLGFGLLFLSWAFRGQAEGHATFTVSGVIAISLGLGFLLSGGASHRLAAGMRRNDG